MRDVTIAGFGCLACTIAVSGYAKPAQGGPQRAPTLSDIRQYEKLIFTEVSTGETWSVVQGKYVTLNYVPSDKLNLAAAKNLTASFDRCASADCANLQLEAPAKQIPVYLYPRLDDLQRAVGVKKNFGGGMSLGSWAAIVAPPGKDSATASAADLEANGAHIIGQALLHVDIGLYSCPLFAEGAAYYLQGKYRSSPWISNPTPLQTSSLEILADRAESPGEFLQGARFLTYLIKLDHGNPARLKTLLGGLNHERLDQIRKVGTGSWVERVNRVFTATYGKRLDQLEADWRRAKR